MELNINSPAYYTNENGINDEVYSMCRELEKFFKDRIYSDYIDIVGIVPIIAPKEEISKGLWKEVKKVELKSRFASLSLQIDYNNYIIANDEEKKSMIIDNVLKSIKIIHRRAKFDYYMFEKDMKLFCEKNHIILI